MIEHLLKTNHNRRWSVLENEGFITVSIDNIDLTDNGFRVLACA